jgi:hypothetical protein
MIGADRNWVSPYEGDHHVADKVAMFMLANVRPS